MSQLTHSDVIILAKCFQFDATLLNADHWRIRSCINNLPPRFRESILPHIELPPLGPDSETKGPCPVHSAISLKLVTDIFDSLRKELKTTIELINEFAFCLGPEENFIVGRVSAIQGMWLNLTGFSPKMRNWDLQTNKCRACMLSRVASNPPALRDLRTLLLVKIEEDQRKSDPYCINPSDALILSFVDAWINLSHRKDELINQSEYQVSVITAARYNLDNFRTKTVGAVYAAFSHQHLPARPLKPTRLAPKPSQYQPQAYTSTTTLTHALQGSQTPIRFSKFPFLTPKGYLNNSTEISPPPNPPISEEVHHPPSPSSVYSDHFNLDDDTFDDSPTTNSPNYNSTFYIPDSSSSAAASSDDSLTSFTLRNSDGTHAPRSRLRMPHAGSQSEQWLNSGASFGSFFSTGQTQQQYTPQGSGSAASGAIQHQHRQEEQDEPEPVSRWSDSTIEVTWKSLWNATKAKRKKVKAGKKVH